MLQLIKDIKLLPIISLRTGGKIGVVKSPIINPNNLKIVAWSCDNRLEKENSILLSRDIRDIIDKGMLINDQDALSSVEDLVRLQEIIKINFGLIGIKVITNTKRKLGKVIDYAVEVDSMYIKKIYVGQSIIRNISGSSLSIDRTQVLEVTDKHIVVRDSTESVADENPQPITQPLPSPATN